MGWLGWAGLGWEWRLWEKLQWRRRQAASGAGAARRPWEAGRAHPYACAVVLDLQHLDAPLLDRDCDLRGSRVEAVLQQLLQRAGRALHHFAGRDAVDHGLVEA